MKKTFKSRMTSIFAAFVMTILFAVCAAPVSADEIDTAAAPVISVSAEADIAGLNTGVPTVLSNTAAAAIPEPFIFAAAADGGAGAASGSNEADVAYQSVINFFITWIRRIGWMVAFVGAIMFALAIKNDDPDRKQSGLMTMVAGFVVAAICIAANMFHLFT